MPEVTIVYWRDIPAQVIVGAGRRAAKMPLPERFEQAIDRCAMKVGATRPGRLPRANGARASPTLSMATRRMSLPAKPRGWKRSLVRTRSRP